MLSAPVWSGREGKEDSTELDARSRKEKNTSELLASRSKRKREKKEETDPLRTSRDHKGGKDEKVLWPAPTGEHCTFLPRGEEGPLLLDTT